MSALVIVESPAKAKTIEKYLGKGYTVKASKGHIVDLPKSGLGVDVDDEFKPDYAVVPGKQKVITELKRALVDKDMLIIASDPDREGEAIGWHVANKLGAIGLNGKKLKKGKPLQRIVFTEITKEAVQAALKAPRDLDLNLLNAQQTRRVLDRLVGYKLSPLLWKKIMFGLSAGRVQSVAVKFIVDREHEREKFVAEEYWDIFAYLSESKIAEKAAKLFTEAQREDLPGLPEGQIKFNLTKVSGAKLDAKDEKSVTKIVESLEGSQWILTNVQEKLTARNPKAPFTTSTLQQTAANWLGFSAKKTMTLAQKLYESGLISYMRTDSTNLSQQALGQARDYATKNLGEKFLPVKPNIYRTKIKVAQEAHEAIRPANFNADLDSKQFNKLELDQQKLYRLIWQRALASQLVSAQLQNVTATIELSAQSKVFEFRANGQRVVFPGYLEVYPEKVSEYVLPKLAKGQELNLGQLLASQHYTQPPARFSEATLVKELEKYGIGRPSTYAPIISTIQARKYVEKENGYFKPTDTAFVVIKLLAKHFSEIVDRDFTANMEDDLDKIANGEVDWQEFLARFYKPFAEKLVSKEADINREDFTVLADAPDNIKCPVCGAKMLLKLGRFGRFYSCSRFPECKGILSESGETKEEIEAEADAEEFKSTYETAPLSEEGKPYLLKRGKFGKFWAHPDYPKVKDAKPLVLLPHKLRELYGAPPLTKDGRDFLFRAGKFGKFWAHPDYPTVKETVPIKEKKVEPETDIVLQTLSDTEVDS